MPMPLLPPVTMATFPLRLMASTPPWSRTFVDGSCSSAFYLGFAASRWSPTRSALAIAVSAGFTAPMLRKEARVDDVQVVELVRLAVRCRAPTSCGSRAEAARARLVRDAADVDLVLHVQIARDQVVVHVEVIEHRLELLVELLLGHLVGRRVAERDAAVALDRDAILGRGRSSVESQKSTACCATISSDHCGARPVSIGFSPRNIGALRLADHLDVAHRVLEARHAEVEVVQPERLLVLRRVRLLRDGEHRLAVVEHVVAPDLVRAVGEPVRMLVVGRHEQQLGRVGGAAGDDDDARLVRLLHCPSRSTTTLVTAVPAGLVSSFVDQRVRSPASRSDARAPAARRAPRRRSWRGRGTESRRNRCSGRSG